MSVDESPGAATTGAALAMPIAHTAAVVRARSRDAILRGELLILSLAINGSCGLHTLMQHRSAGGGTANQPPSYDSTGWFNRAVERAQVQKITPHDLRHTCASLAVSSGANVLAVSRMLGHKDPSVTLRIYADLFDSDLDAVAVNLDAKIADSVQSVSKAPADRRRKRRKAAV